MAVGGLWNEANSNFRPPVPAGRLHLVANPKARDRPKPTSTPVIPPRGIGDIAFVETGDQPAFNDQKNAHGRKADVIARLMTSTLADVVQAKNLMVNEILDEVEDAPVNKLHPKKA